MQFDNVGAYEPQCDIGEIEGTLNSIYLSTNGIFMQ